MEKIGLEYLDGQVHTFRMTMTSIRVDSEVRDALREQARADAISLGEHLRRLAAAEDNRRAKEEMLEAMKKNPPDQEYLDEAQDWQSDRWS